MRGAALSATELRAPIVTAPKDAGKVIKRYQASITMLVEMPPSTYTKVMV